MELFHLYHLIIRYNDITKWCKLNNMTVHASNEVMHASYYVYTSLKHLIRLINNTKTMSYNADIRYGYVLYSMWSK